jgi:signal transduction histidine kinase
MKLTGKLVFYVILVIIIMLAIHGFLTIKIEINIIRTDMQNDALVFAYGIRNLFSHVLQADGREKALDLLADTEMPGSLLTLRWVSLDADSDEKHQPMAEPKRLAPVLEGQMVSFVAETDKGDERLFNYIPVNPEHVDAGVIELTETTAPMRRHIRSTIYRMVALTIIIILMAAVLVVTLGIRMVGKPIEMLTEKAKRVGTGDLTGPISLHGRDELSELSREINTMCDQLDSARERVRSETEARIAALEQLRHADRLKTVGKLASGIAHELGTPLNVISGRAAMIMSGDLTESDVTKNAEIVKSQSDRIAVIIRDFLDFARQRRPQKTIADINEVVEKTVEFLHTLAESHECDVRLHMPAEKLTALVDSGQISQVLTNLIVNAIQASLAGSVVDVTLGDVRAQSPLDQGAESRDYIRVDVADRGKGIPREDISRVFDPFFTTKDPGKGTGLGLSIAYGITREHGGWIDLESTPGHGSRFSIYLPMEKQS